MNAPEPIVTEHTTQPRWFKRVLRLFGFMVLLLITSIAAPLGYAPEDS